MLNLKTLYLVVSTCSNFPFLFFRVLLILAVYWNARVLESSSLLACLSQTLFLCLFPDARHILGNIILNDASQLSSAELRTCHPSPVNILKLWQIFLDNFDPLCKFIHGPTTQTAIINLVGDLDHISKDWNAFMFGIYLSATQSMSPAQCHQVLGEAKDKLILRFQMASKVALQKADFMNTSSLLTIQAFLLYLVWMPCFPQSSCDFDFLHIGLKSQVCCVSPLWAICLNRLTSTLSWLSFQCVAIWILTHCGCLQGLLYGWAKK